MPSPHSQNVGLMSTRQSIENMQTVYGIFATLAETVNEKKNCLLYPNPPTLNPLPKPIFRTSGKWNFFFAPFSSGNQDFPIMEQWKKKQYDFFSLPTYQTQKYREVYSKQTIL